MEATAAPPPPHDAPADVWPAARAVDATKTYGTGHTTVVALDKVTVDLPAGRFTAIMGPSGSGKSTLMHCMAGLDSLTSGQVFIGDQDLGTLSEDQLTLLRRDRVGFVFQAYNLVPTLTAEENITLPLTLAGRTADKEWFDTVDLEDRLRHKPKELSGDPPSSSPTSPPATSTPGRGPRSSTS